MAINKHDFIELDYTGRIKGSGEVFDTTDEKVAKDTNIHNPKLKYGPVTICVGEAQVLLGIDEQVVGKALGKYTFDIPVESGFGKKDPKLLHLVPLSKFKKDNIQPMPGLQIQVDGSIGVVKTVSGGRVIIDFNNPLAGKDLVYDVNILGLVVDSKKQIESFISLFLNNQVAEVEVKGEKKDSAVVSFPFDLPGELKDELEARLLKVVKGVKTIEFVKKEPKKAVKQ